MRAINTTHTLKNFIEIISKVEDTLNQNEDTLKTLFEDKSIIRYKDIITQETVCEINNEIGTLTCLLTPEDRCHSGYLFFHSMTGINEFVDYCNKMFNTVTQHYWTTSKMYIKLIKQKTDSFLEMTSF